MTEEKKKKSIRRKPITPDPSQAQQVLAQDAEARRQGFLQEYELMVEGLKKKWNCDFEVVMMFRRGQWLSAVDAIPLMAQPEAAAQATPPNNNGGDPN